MKHYLLTFSFIILTIPPPWLQGQSLSALMQESAIFEKQQKTQQALDALLLAEKIAPTNAQLMVSIAKQTSYLMTEATNDADKLRLGNLALSYSEKAVKLDPNLCDAYLSVAVCQGKLLPLMGVKESILASRAIKSAVDRALVIDPMNDLAWHILGRWHQLLADVSGFKKTIAQLVYGNIPSASNEESVKYLEKAIALNPERLMHYIELGRTYAQMGQSAEASKYIKKGLAMPDREKEDPDTKKRGRDTLDECCS